jgi:hypothetical protein
VAAFKSRVVRAGIAVTFSVVLISGTSATAGATTNVPVPGPSILNNGNFSLPASDDGDASPANGGSIPGWLVGGTNYLQVYSLRDQGVEPPPGATYMVKLGGGHIIQTVKTTPGWTYLLQWYESGYPGYGPPEFKSISWHKVVDVIWGGKVVASAAFNAQPNTAAHMRWALRQEVLTATSASTTLEFYDVTHETSVGYSAMIGNASLAGYAKMYLPAVTSVSASGKLLAIVDTATGHALSDPSLALKLYGTWKQKTASYAPPTVVTKLIASGSVVDGQVPLQLHLPASVAGKTVAGVALLSGPGFIPVKDSLTIKVS